MSIVRFFADEPINIDLIDETFQQAFNQDFDRAYWKWRFEENPLSNKTYISYILEDDCLAGYYAVSPCTVNITHLGEAKIALSNMTMTHPKYQGRGYFKTLAMELYKQLAQDGFIGVYGFANANSHYGFRKYLGWQDLGITTIFQADSKSFRPFLLQEKNGTRIDEQIVDASILELASIMQCSAQSITIQRDFKTLNWRFLSNPSHEYHSLKIYKQSTLAAILVYKNFNKTIDMMEFFFSEEFHADSEALLGIAVRYLLDQTDAVNFWSNLYSPEHLFLEKLGFIETAFNSYFGVIPFTEDLSLLDIKNWHYRFMDSDIF